MFQRIVLLACILMLAVGSVSAYNPNVNVSVDTTIVNSTYLDVNIWVLILLLGIIFMFISHIPGFKNEVSAIWAVLSPFFTFAATWFSTSLQYASVTTFYDTTTGKYSIITEHFIYHLDWLAVGVLGILFLFSFVNVFYILTRKNVEKPNPKEVYGVPTDTE